MLLTAWKHTERNRHRYKKDYLLLFPEVSCFQYRAWQLIAYFRAYLPSNHFKGLNLKVHR